MEYIIQVKQTGVEAFLFGNRSFTSEKSGARKFETRLAAQSHIDHWFDNSQNVYGVIPELNEQAKIRSYASENNSNTIAGYNG